MGFSDGRQGTGDGGEGRASAFDLPATGPASGGAAPPPKKATMGAHPATAPTAAVAPTGAADIATGAATVLEAVAPRVTLQEDVIVALLHAPLGLTVDETQAEVQASYAQDAATTGAPVEHLARGPVEAKLLALLDGGTVQREGDRFVLTVAARTLYENPSDVVARRASILGTLAFFEDSLGESPGIGLTGLQINLAAPAFEPGMDEDTGPGALTLAGFAPMAITLDVLEADLVALVQSGVLLSRSYAAELKLREAQAADEDEEFDADDVVEEPHYAFAPGALAKFYFGGGALLATPSVPAAPQAVAHAAREASAGDRTGFEQNVVRDLEAERDLRKVAERHLGRLETLLASKGLTHLYVEAREPTPVEASDELHHYTMQLTRPMNDAERAVLLREAGEADKKIREWKAAVDGAKAASNAVVAASREKLPDLEQTKIELFQASDAPERSYEVSVYDEFHPDGDARSEGRPVLYRRATVGKRIVERETLTPARALELHAARGVLVVAGVAPDPGDVHEKVVKGRAASPLAAAAAAIAGTPGVLSQPLAAAVSEFKAAVAKTGGTVTLSVPGGPSVTVGQRVPEAEPDDFDAVVAKQAASKPRVELNVTALRPVVLALLAAAGPRGLDRADVPGAVSGAAGIPLTPSVSALVGRVVDGFSDRDVLRNAGRVAYPMRVAVLALVADAGETGLRMADLGERFTAKTGVQIPDGDRGVPEHLEWAVNEAVRADDLARGPLGGELGDLLWLAGQTDPRVLGTKQAAAVAAASGSKGRKGAAKTAAVKKPKE